MSYRTTKKHRKRSQYLLFHSTWRSFSFFLMSKMLLLWILRPLLFLLPFGLPKFAIICVRQE